MIEEQKFYWTLLDTLKDGVYFADKKRKITYWNKAAETITGYRSGEILGRHCGDNFLIHIDEEGNNLCTGPCPLARTMETKEPCERKIFLHHKNGHRVPVLVRVNPVFGSEDEVIGAVEIFTDLSSKESLLKDIQALAQPGLQGSITGLPAKHYLEMQLKLKLVEWNEFKHPFGVFLIKVGGLEEVKDTYSQGTVENILKVLSNTLIHNVDPCDMVGEWAEGEFFGIAAHADEEKVATNANRYRILLERTRVSAEETSLSLTFSVASVLARPDDTFETLIEKVTKTPG
ncbi:MAG: PAS domain-containing protein [Candidatus Aminicenantes bacterium]|nr:MAG: PAS domain-containing protein [Candidatus Aminicenantes bacterium]